MVEVEDHLLVREDGSLTLRTAMARLGELTISTHGRGEVVTGSVRVVANGPIGGVLRFDIPGVGVAGRGRESTHGGRPVPGAAAASRDPHRGGDPQPGGAARNGAVPVDERGRGPGRGGHPSQRPRTACPVHRRGLHPDGYQRLRRISEMHGSRGRPVHGSRGGAGHRQPDLHHPAGGADSKMTRRE